MVEKDCLKCRFQQALYLIIPIVSVKAFPFLFRIKGPRSSAISTYNRINFSKRFAPTSFVCEFKCLHIIFSFSSHIYLLEQVFEVLVIIPGDQSVCRICVTSDCLDLPHLGCRHCSNKYFADVIFDEILSGSKGATLIS